MSFETEQGREADEQMPGRSLNTSKFLLSLADNTNVFLLLLSVCVSFSLRTRSFPPMSSICIPLTKL